MKQSYTMDLMQSMINGLIEGKLSKGYKRLNNGLFEDCVGQVYTVGLDQNSVPYEEGVLGVIRLQFKAVSVAGRL